MKKVFLFENDQGGIVVCYPADCGLSIEEIARKDVPSGKPFLIVEESALPEDHTYFEAWEADFSQPDGFGIGHQAWFAEQEAKALLENPNKESEEVSE